MAKPWTHSVGAAGFEDDTPSGICHARGGHKKPWTAEAILRAMKSQRETRPIFHKTDDTIRGHVFCSDLALVLRRALQDRLEA